MAHHENPIKSQAAVIFGASGGIGSALAWNLHQKGYRLALVARQEVPLRAIADKMGALSISANITYPEEVQRCFEIAENELGPIEGVANCVGSILVKPAHLISDQEWMDTLQINLTTSFSIVRSSARTMMSRGGSIVLISTVAGRVGLPNHDALGAAKAGVIGLALSSAASYAPRGIRINVVAPGLIDTHLSDELTRPPAHLKASLGMHPISRMGRPEEVASAIAWFLDPAQSWVTGQVLGVDGGLSTLRAKVGIH